MARRRSSTYRRLLMGWTRAYYDRYGSGFPFGIEEALAGMGFPPVHPKHATVRDWIRNFFSKSRNEFKGIAEYFFSDPKYREFTEDGLAEEEVWMRVWEVCMEFNYLPVWSDPKDNGLYKPMKGATFVSMKERRGRAIVREVKNTVNAMDFLFEKFPALPPAFHRQRLEADSHFLEILPPRTITCEVCGLEVPGQADFAQHFGDEHSDT